MTPRAILFDLDDTLIPEWPAIRAGYAAVAQRVWDESSPERIASLQNAARAVWRAGRPTAYAKRVHFSLGEALYGEFVAAGADADALRAFVPQLHAGAFDAALPPAWRGRSPELVALWKATRIDALAPYPETLAVLEHLTARLPVALVTNGASRLQRAKLTRTDLEGRFATVVVSEEIGVGKPDPAPFAAALDRLGVEPSETVMVGNDPARDVAGARAAGIRPIWVDRGDTAPDGVARIADLRELEVLLSHGSRPGHRDPL
jgi:putative hydrolase of the HAD superfamily